ncbi:AbrB family transcriptional regulator [Marinobacterium sp. LSUCC0821]|uniref:AbrB family transcriptional regulator n=1 Tax=Marinobacterium sp. LSUCC0821 TaxID=2668067 RepID=UPI001B7CEC2F|nr:AbrB family transcriptional regulator [Marinobacterium sp. LSUCC0821]
MITQFIERQRTRISTFSFALLGVAAFKVLDLPLPFLFGPLFACLAAALLGAKLRGFGVISKIGRVILGVAIGSSLTPAVIHVLPSIALSVAFIPLYVILIGLIGVPFFERVGKLDRQTAYYAAMPGGLQDMVVFGIEAGADPKALSLIHATRVLIVVVVAPLLVSQLFGASLDRPIGAPAISIPGHELLLLALSGVIGWQVAERLKLFGATILGPMLASAILSLSGAVDSRPPAEALIFAQFFIGLGIGVYYTGVKLKEVAGLLAVATVFILILAALAAIFTIAIASIDMGHSQLDIFLAYAPGGQAEMTLLAIISGADLGFIIVHHLTRMILVILGAPFVARLFLTRTKN